MNNQDRKLIFSTVHTNPARQRSLASIQHPVFVLAVLALLVNSFLLQPYYPSWLSGKLGDLAWMVIAPILVTSIVSWVVPGFIRKHETLAGIIGMAVIGLLFVAVKCVTPLNAAARDIYSMLTGMQLKLVLDYSDLLVLPGLLISGEIWRRTASPQAPIGMQPVSTRVGKVPKHRLWASVCLGLAILAIAADMPAPAELGVTCLIEKDADLYAFDTMIYGKNQEILWAAYRSADGGLTWARTASKTKTTPTVEENKATLVYGSCQLKKLVYDVTDPSISGVHYLFAPGTAVYRSEDGGETMKKEFSLVDKAVTDFVWHKMTGNLVIALGKNGIILRTKSGEWVEIPVNTFKGANY